jgi:hypothetical protein
MDYLISYIYTKEERAGKDLQTLKLRLLGQQELKRMVTAAEQEAGVTLETLGIYDRSLLIGRHMDTCDYNPHLVPLREQVNSLFALNLRTDLEAMQIAYHPHKEFRELNSFFTLFTACWDALIRFAADSMGKGNPAAADYIPSLPEEPWQRVLRSELEHLARVFPGAGELRATDLRANILEPQLANSLRNLEYQLQPGIGCGHGFLSILQVNKKES